MGNSVSTQSEQKSMETFKEPPPANPINIESAFAAGDGPEASIVPNVENELPSMEKLHDVAHDVFPTPFEGVKVVVNQALNQHFQMSHSLNLGSSEQNGYRLGATYVGHKKISETECFPVCLAELQPNGCMHAQIFHQPFNNIRGKYIAQLQPARVVGQQLTVDMKYPQWQCGLSVLNPNIASKQVTAIADIMWRIGDNYSAGSMLLYQKHPQSPFGHDAMWNLGGQYRTKDGKWTAGLSVRPLQLGLHTSLHLKVNKELQLAAELETAFQQTTSVTSIGYQYEWEIDSRNSFTVKSQLDSTWNVGTSVERKCHSTMLPFSLVLSAVGNLVKSKYGLGIGISLFS